MLRKYLELWLLSDVFTRFYMAVHYASQSAGPKPIPNLFGGFDDFTKSWLVEGATAIFKAKKSCVKSG